MRTFLARLALVIGLLAAAPLAGFAQTPAAPAPSPGANLPGPVVPGAPPPGATQPTEPAAPAASTLPAPAAAVPSATATAAGPSSGDRSYILGVGDAIEVSVLGRTDFNTRARVGTDGSVILPLLGAVQAINRSPGQLADEVRLALEKGGYYSQPAVRIDVVGVASRFITILGSIGSPGLMALDRQYHLSEVVARAGGRTGSGADYVLLTRGNAAPLKFKIADLATGSGDKDPVVESGDRIYVPPAENEVFYITGAVKAPGAYPAAADLTVRIALARAGGLGDTGSEGKISINRKGTQMKGVKPDTTKVEPGDIITVGEKLF